MAIIFHMNSMFSFNLPHAFVKKQWLYLFCFLCYLYRQEPRAKNFKIKKGHAKMKIFPRLYVLMAFVLYGTITPDVCPIR